MPGWDLTSATCSDDSPVTAISLEPGEVITCTFTNTKRGHIIIDKVTIPSGDSASFEFDSNYGANFTPDRRTGSERLRRPRARHLLGGRDCPDRLGSDRHDAARIDSPVHGHQPASRRDHHLHVHQHQARHDHRGEADQPRWGHRQLHLHRHRGRLISDDGTITVDNLVPGTYTSTEADPSPNFDLLSILCDDGAEHDRRARSTWIPAPPPSSSIRARPSPASSPTSSAGRSRSSRTLSLTATRTSPSPRRAPASSGFSLDDDGDDANSLSNTKVFQNLVKRRLLGHRGATSPAGTSPTSTATHRTARRPRSAWPTARQA